MILKLILDYTKNMKEDMTNILIFKMNLDLLNFLRLTIKKNKKKKLNKYVGIQNKDYFQTIQFSYQKIKYS